MDKVENTVVDEVNIKKYVPSILQKLEWLDREELIKRFISVEFNRFLEYYKDAPDINVENNDRRSGSPERSAVNFDRFHINLGMKHGLSASALISFINRNCQGKRIEFGKIEILRNFSFFEVDQTRAGHLLEDMDKAQFDGFPVQIELSAPSEGSAERSRSSHATHHSERSRGGYADRDSHAERSRSERSRSIEVTGGHAERSRSTGAAVKQSCRA